MRKFISIFLSLLFCAAVLGAVPASSAETASIPKVLALNGKDCFEYQYFSKDKTLTIRNYTDQISYEYLLPLVPSDDISRQNIMLTCDYRDDCIILALSDLVRSGIAEHINTPQAHYDFQRNRKGQVVYGTETFETDPIPYYFFYDAHGRLVRILQKLEDSVRTYTYRYRKGALYQIEIRDSSVQKLTLKTDGKGRITSFTEVDSSGPTRIVQTYAYDTAGRPAEVTYHEEGVGADPVHRSRTQMQYNAQNQMTGFTFSERDSEGKYDADWTIKITHQTIS